VKIRAFLMLAALSMALPHPGRAEPAAPEAEAWTLVTASDETLVYMRLEPTVAAGAVRRAWTMYDSARPLTRDGVTFRSVKSLGEFDCAKGVSRVISETFHSEAALRGSVWSPPNPQTSPWAPAAPNSVGELRAAFACAGFSKV
jgi:hypothetical protein